MGIDQRLLQANRECTNGFPFSTGEPQGCLLMPLLINLYTNDVVNVLKEDIFLQQKLRVDLSRCHGMPMLWLFYRKLKEASSGC